MPEIGLISCVKAKRDGPTTPKDLYTSDYFGEGTVFAYAERSDLNASHKREGIETDLIRACYLEVGEAPLMYFGIMRTLLHYRLSIE